MLRKISACMLMLVLALSAWAADPLPSWNPGPAKSRIVNFVVAASDSSLPGFIPPTQRVAVFDNDGTLWSEQPLYVQFFFAMDRAAELAAANPDWASTPTLEAAAAGDVKAVLANGQDGLLELVTATHSNTTVAAFTADARRWIAQARHPQTGRLFTDMVFQPMLELLAYLRSNGFDVYIVSGGGLDFMRAFAEPSYGVPPENVIGSLGAAHFEIGDGMPRIMKDPAIAFIDDGAQKPVAIYRQIGRRPVFVAGNSDGDLAMAQWATAGSGARLALFVHHTDDEREFAYDRQSDVGKLSKALDAAPAAGWVVVDMAHDWTRIWPDGSP